MLQWGPARALISRGGIYPCTASSRSLTGEYGGIGAEATAGYGVGANALIGGSGRGIILQPLSVQAQMGLNIAVGIQSLVLRAD